MDGRRNVLGIIAVALGALALVVSLGGRGEPRFEVNIDGSGALAQRGSSAAQVVPTPQARSNESATERGTEARGDRFAQHGGPSWARGEEMGGPPWGRGDRHFGPGAFFPFMILGGLFKLLFAVGLIMFGLRLFRGRGGRGGPGRGGPGRWRGRPAVHEPMPGDHRRQAAHTPENNYL